MGDFYCRLFEDAASVFTGDPMGKPAFESDDGDDVVVVVVVDDDDDNDVVVFANLKLDFCDLRCSLAF